MSMSPEDMRALSEARGRQVTRPTSQTLDPGLVSEARGYYGDETYINELVANTGVGSGTLEERQNALNTLIQQGKARNLAERGSEDAFPGAPIISGNTGEGDNNDEEEFVKFSEMRDAILKEDLTRLYEDGVPVVGERKLKPYDKATVTEIDKALDWLKSKATRETKEKLFGAEKSTMKSEIDEA